MKRTNFITAILFCVTVSAFGQEDIFYSNQASIETKENTQPEKTYKIFLGPGIGVNNSCGMLGVLFEANPIKKLSVLAGLGIGSWGYKAALGARYYNRGFPHKLFYGLSFTTASGMDGFETELETTRSTSEKVELDLHRANNLAASVGYQWRLFKNGRLNFEAGYSFPLQGKSYTVVTPGVELTDESEAVMDFLTPGGLVLGLAFTIGF
jgi:hypothetical protein